VLCHGQPPLAGKELVGGRERGGHGVELEHRLGRTARLATGPPRARAASAVVPAVERWIGGHRVGREGKEEMACGPREAAS
jgi:hypothetical protein